MHLLESEYDTERLFRDPVECDPLSDPAEVSGSSSPHESLAALSRLIHVLASHRRGVTISIAPARVIQGIIRGMPSTFASLEEKFMALADEWLDSQSGKSRIDFSHPAHLQIIGMGAAAIPFLLKEIQDCSGNWFEAIRSIAGSSPVTVEFRGDFEAVTKAWIKWGSENGYARMENRQGDVDAVEIA